MSFTPILSIVTGDSLIRSGVLEAETTISSSWVSAFSKTASIFALQNLLAPFE